MENFHSSQSEREPRYVRFVRYTIRQCHDHEVENTGLRARLKRADNPALQYQSWDYFAAFGLDIEKETEFLPYAIVAAAIAKTKRLKDAQDGHLFLGTAIAECYRDENNKQDDPRDNKQAQAKLRRLLACQDIRELYRVSRSMLSLIESRVPQPLNYTHLLDQLTWFGGNRDRVKARWAMEFYRKSDQPLPRSDASLDQERV